MREWADLPGELLELILSNVYGKDKHNFRLVCRSWNEAAAGSAYSHSPCLMFYQKSRWKFFQFNGLFSMSFPELNEASIRCSKYGWLLVSRDDWSLFFFDPFNRLTIELPSPTDIQYTTIHFFNPPSSPNCFLVGIAALIWCDKVQISVLKHGEHKWNSCTYKSKDQFWVSVSAPVLHCGQLYFVDMKGDVASFDIEKHGDPSSWVVYTKCLRFRWLRNKIKQHFLFKIKGEEALYAVFLILEDKKVNVYRLLEPDMEWELVKDLGDKMLYLSHTSSFGDTTRLKTMANAIYFPMFHGDNMLFYSLDTRKYHSFEGYYSNNNSYDLARFDSATWIMPAPTPELSTGLTWCSEADADDSEEYDDSVMDGSDADDSEEDHVN